MERSFFTRPNRAAFIKPKSSSCFFFGGMFLFTRERQCTIIYYSIIKHYVVQQFNGPSKRTKRKSKILETQKKSMDGRTGNPMIYARPRYFSIPTCVRRFYIVQCSFCCTRLYVQYCTERDTRSYRFMSLAHTTKFPVHSTIFYV